MNSYIKQRVISTDQRNHSYQNWLRQCPIYMESQQQKIFVAACVRTHFNLIET